MVHHLGRRADQPFLTLDCRRIPREALEGELFGVERETVNGSSTAIPGRLELAAGGTLVIDEVAALDSVAQAKLLRAIEDKQAEPVAGSRPIPVKARIIVLTSIGIENAVARRAFREDLYYRLNALTVLVPPLRDRPADIAPLAERFLDTFSEIQRRPRIACTPAAMAALEQYSFPGNVTELQCIVERAAASGGDEITLADLPPHVRGSEDLIPNAQVSLEEIEQAHIAKVLQFTQGKKSRAAKLLGISRKTLLEKRKKFGLG
jgi:DNA-binding NtrC family response regulator